MSDHPDLPRGVTWQERPFPDANLLLLDGTEAALVDSGFVGHAEETTTWVTGHSRRPLRTVVNTHWHADHVGGNATLQRAGAAVAASVGDAEAVRRRDAGCCQSTYLDQPVAPYTVDRALDDGEVIRLGDDDWQVIATPGHTPGHLCLWQPEHRLLAVGDALSDYDVGWVNLALDGPDATAVAVRSLERLVALTPRVLLPAHGSIPIDTAATLDAALRRAQRLVDDPDGAVWYGARRILAYALMIRGGIDRDQLDAYLVERSWVRDAARLLRRDVEVLVAELVTTMLDRGALVERDGRVHANAPHTPVAPTSLDQPAPADWPPTRSSPAAELRPRPGTGP